MTPYEAYVLYCALKSHFTTEEYDFIKYNGKIRASAATFEKRRDRFFFAKLAKKKEVKDYLISIFIQNKPIKWIGDIVNNSTLDDAFTEWKKRTQSLSYSYEEDLKKLLTNLEENITITEHQHPFMLKLFLRGKISIETLVILNDLTKFFSYWNKHLENDPLWNEVELLCRKYRSFLQYDRKEMRKITTKVFNLTHK